MTVILCGRKCWWNQDNVCTKKMVYIKHDTGECMDYVEKEDIDAKFFRWSY